MLYTMLRAGVSDESHELMLCHTPLTSVQKTGYIQSTMPQVKAHFSNTEVRTESAAATIEQTPTTNYTTQHNTTQHNTIQHMFT